PTRRHLLPRIDAILARLAAHRAAVDEVFAKKRAGLGATATTTAGEAPLIRYPIGFCSAIRDQVFERLLDDREFHALVGPEVVFKKIFVLLKGRYFQNALQLGNLYVDVANDTVDLAKPKLEWLRIDEVDYENADDWPAVAAVGRRYYEIELYPNFLFPLAFPAAPYFAIRASGRIDFFQAQDLVFLKDLGDGFRRARALLDDPAFLARPLPEPYRALLEKACGGNLHAAFPLEFAPTDAYGLRERVLPEFAALDSQGNAAAATIVQNYLRLIADATRRLARLDLRPDPATLARLRADGAIPPP
ncbi:MAG: hypothetical protein H7067_05455, partial [Burkholderiales bacterium]|nr:hypothetical protein [Opitutaceae bacterium]